jgi:FdrA protein
VTDCQVVEVRTGAYHDSVTLMRVSRQLSDRPGVIDALTAMATELNLDLLDRLELPAPAGVGPNDLVVAIRATDQSSLDAAREALDGLLTAPPPPTGGFEPPPARTVGSAARRIDATLALVSVPGRHAFPEAVDALEAGLNVMIFSDNMPVDQEITLKEMAARRGLLVMGPDCGTAVVGGVGLGFANSVRAGKVGLVAASGTGSQQVMCLLDTAGAGVSHALGVGGRDLSAAVSGRSTLQALAALDADPATELIIVVSKPPAPRVADLIHAAARRLGKPVLFALLGEGPDDLTSVVEKALTALGLPLPEWPSWIVSNDSGGVHGSSGPLRGLFVGGTLCDEAMLIASDTLGEIKSNIPLRPEWEIAPSDGAPGAHLMIDFGDDRLTQGRAHPMIDPTLRLERLAAETTGGTAGVVLLDVVLGHAADPDPADTLAPVIAASSIPVVVSLCGTSTDPQDRDYQAGVLSEAGAAVFTSNAMAARYAVSQVAPVEELRTYGPGNPRREAPC